MSRCGLGGNRISAPQGFHGPISMWLFKMYIILYEWSKYLYFVQISYEYIYTQGCSPLALYLAMSCLLNYITILPHPLFSSRSEDFGPSVSTGNKRRTMSAETKRLFAFGGDASSSYYFNCSLQQGRFRTTKELARRLTIKQKIMQESSQAGRQAGKQAGGQAGRRASR